MLKCFLCGEEYDEKNRKIAFFHKKGDKVEPVKRIAFVSNGKCIQLCERCVKSASFGFLCNLMGVDNHGIVGLKVEFEPDDNG